MEVTKKTNSITLPINKVEYGSLFKHGDSYFIMVDEHTNTKGCDVETGKIVPFKEGTEVENFHAKIVIK